MPEGLAAQIIYAHDRRCCIHRDASSAAHTQIHHINGNHSDNDVENLALLCMSCHSDAHLRGAFVRSLSPEVIRLYRDEWIQVVTHQRYEAQRQDKDAGRLLLDESHFVGDVTIPDGTIVTPGEHFTKTWAVQNAGQVPWINRRLIRIGLSDGPTVPQTPRWVPIPDTQPSETVEISVEVEAPKVEGSSFVMWKMADSRNALCFPDKYPYGLFLQIHTLRNRNGA